MSAIPEPPPEGWTLPEAAAALFPGAWSDAWFPDDASAARTVPGILPQPSPWSQVPLDIIDTVAAAVLAGGAIPAGLETVVAACLAYEGETAQRIASALARRAEQRAALPGLLAARLVVAPSRPAVFRRETPCSRWISRPWPGVRPRSRWAGRMRPGGAAASPTAAIARRHRRQARCGCPAVSRCAACGCTRRSQGLLRE